MSNKYTLNMFWHGEMPEHIKTCILSNYLVGWKIKMWCYQHVMEIAKFVSFEDANEIIPESELFDTKINRKTSFAQFADLFRYAVLVKYGGWWFDTDVLSFKRFDAEKSDLILFNERTEDSSVTVNNGIIYVNRPNHPFAVACYNSAKSQIGNLTNFTQIGPALILKLCKEFPEYASAIRSEKHYYEINWFETRSILQSIDFDTRIAISNRLSDSYGIHIWNSLLDKKALSDSNSVISMLLDKVKSDYQEHMYLCELRNY